VETTLCEHAVEHLTREDQRDQHQGGTTPPPPEEDIQDVRVATVTTIQWRTRGMPLGQPVGTIFGASKLAIHAMWNIQLQPLFSAYFCHFCIRISLDNRSALVAFEPSKVLDTSSQLGQLHSPNPNRSSPFPLSQLASCPIFCFFCFLFPAVAVDFALGFLYGLSAAMPLKGCLSRGGFTSLARESAS
jgi:hypothetical protein